MKDRIHSFPCPSASSSVPTHSSHSRNSALARCVHELLPQIGHRDLSWQRHCRWGGRGRAEQSAQNSPSSSKNHTGSTLDPQWIHPSRGSEDCPHCSAPAASLYRHTVVHTHQLQSCRSASSATQKYRKNQVEWLIHRNPCLPHLP